MNYQMLVDRKHGLDENFVPKNLVDVKSAYKDGIKLEAIAYEHWLQLKKKVATEGFTIEAESGYRSYDYQSKILKDLISQKGSDYAYKAVALPGHSEHQTGLAIDYSVVKNGQFLIEGDLYNDDVCCFTNSIAHHYGFIVRYPSDKEAITGYKYEPWHLRYVGESLATYLYNNKLTLDEYYMEENNEKS
jgi:D-alanyl-D-alanine carboxypeptidase